MSLLAEVLCSMSPLANQKIKEIAMPLIEEALFEKNRLIGLLLGKDNEYYPMPEMPWSSHAQCSGL